MPNDDFSDAALVLVGHGSTSNQTSTATTYQHAAELRRRKIFGQVQERFWMVEPTIRGLLDQVQNARVFIIPLFLSEGYFTEEAIPTALGLKSKTQRELVRRQCCGGHLVHYGHPLGDHPRITDVILSRARDVVTKHPFPCSPKPAETTLFVAGHGTTKSDSSRRNLDRQVEIIRSQDLYADVHGVFLEDAPRIAECFLLAQTRNLVVVPFFISDGLHTMEDFPVSLGEPPALVQTRLQAGQATWRNPTEKHGKRVWLARCIGSEPLVADMILAQVLAMASAPNLNPPETHWTQRAR